MSYNNEQKLSVKVAVIASGSRGVGAAIAKRLPTEGASVLIAYTKGADAAASVIKEIEGVGGKAITIQTDAGLIAIEAFQPDRNENGAGSQRHADDNHDDPLAIMW